MPASESLCMGCCCGLIRVDAEDLAVCGERVGEAAALGVRRRERVKRLDHTRFQPDRALLGDVAR